MPESPEVQALVEFVGERTVDREIAGFEILDHSEYTTRGIPPSTLDGCRVAGVARHGMYAAGPVATRLSLLVSARHDV